jgi:hypothetical protein
MSATETKQEAGAVKEAICPGIPNSGPLIADNASVLIAEMSDVCERDARKAKGEL